MPVHSPHQMVALSLRLPRGQQGIWETIRHIHRTEEPAEFTAPALWRKVGAHKDAILDYLRRLERGGYIELIRCDGPFEGRKAKVYRLIRDQPDAPKLRRDGSPAKDAGRGQDQLWRAMKMTAQFTIRDLVLAASTAECTVTHETAKSYIKHLLAAGYLKRVAHGVYRLRPDRNTGPLAPQIYRSDWVFDPNLKQGSGPTGGAGAPAPGGEA